MSVHAPERDPTSLSTVAHELRAPITALTASSEVLLADFEMLEPAQIRGMLLTLHRGALWLQSLVENLLCAATIREGRFRIQPQPIRPLDVVLEVQPVLEPLLAQKNQRLRLLPGDGDLEVSGDPRRIGQVLVNLISNASKYSEAGTPVDVGLTARGDAMRVTVADRGPGIPAGSSERLFEPYHRGAPATRSGKEGVGLGLAIVRSIVEAHGGRVGAANRPGGGASFWFELPARSVPVVPRVARESTEETSQ
jgi:two-component system sensor histidine kinase KdpD